MVEWIQQRRRWLFGLIALALLVTLWERWRSRREDRYDGAIIAAAARYGVDAALVKAVVWRESQFDRRATGRAGEVGLMQLMPETAGDWARAERLFFSTRLLYDPEKNTQAGAWYLRKQLDRFRRTDNPIPYALAAYNAGPAHALRWSRGAAATNTAAFLRAIDYPSTRDYVMTVMKRYERYRRHFPPR